MIYSKKKILGRNGFSSRKVHKETYQISIVPEPNWNTFYRITCNFCCVLWKRKQKQKSILTFFFIFFFARNFFLSKAVTLTRLTTQIWHLGIYFVIWIIPPLFVWFYFHHLCCISHDFVGQQNGTVRASLERNKREKSTSLWATGGRWVDRSLSLALVPAQKFPWLAVAVESAAFNYAPAWQEQHLLFLLFLACTVLYAQWHKAYFCVTGDIYSSS